MASKGRRHFEWSISSKGRERECFACGRSTAGTLTLASGLRKALCSGCFSTRLEESLALIGGPRRRRLPEPAPVKALPTRQPQPCQSDFLFSTLIEGVQSMQREIYRQGDVLIRRISSLPTQKAAPRATGILAYGEVTGHAHRVEDLTRAEVLEVGAGLYLRVGEEGVRVVHEEHAPIDLPAGNYEIEIQKEYSPAEIRNVAD